MSEAKQTFTVPFVITLRGTVDIEALTEEDARALAAARLSAENLTIVHSLRYKNLLTAVEPPWFAKLSNVEYRTE